MSIVSLYISIPIYGGVIKTCIRLIHNKKHALITYTSMYDFMIRMILTLLIGSYAGIAISVMSFSAFLA